MKPTRKTSFLLLLEEDRDLNFEFWKKEGLKDEKFSKRYRKSSRCSQESEANLDENARGQIF